MKNIFYIATIFSLTLLIFSCNNSKNQFPPASDDSIQIVISDSNYIELKKNRDSAINLGIIDPSLKNYIIGDLIYKNSKMPVKIRFKGDWVDHLKGDKWSFRIVVLGDNSFKGMKSFSIQSPHTRTFLDEWLMHKIFKKEDILTTRYEFIDVKLNNNQLGIYAYEEHFEKQLLESSNRREGPILKFNEQGLWETRINKKFYNTSFPYYEASEVIPFKKNKTLKNSTLKKNYEYATQLMLKYKEFNGNLNEIFNLKKVARYFALCDLGRVRHSLHWHNQRFYFNPITNKLEHIGFDCFAGIEEGEKDIILGYIENDKFEYPVSYLNKQLFNSKIFKTHYTHYLNKYSSNEYINEIEKEFNSTLKKLNANLNVEFPNYKFNFERYKSNAILIQELLPKYIEKNQNFYLNKRNYSHLDTIGDYYFPSVGLKARWSKSDNNNVILENFHFADIEVIGYANNQFEISPFNKKTILKKYNSTTLEINFTVDSLAKFICFRPLNMKEIAFCKIKNWKYKSDNSFILNNVKTTTNYIPKEFTIDSVDMTIKLIQGSYVFEESIVIPEGWTFIINEGASLNLKDNAYILSYSPVSLIGSKQNPIKFTNGSFIVLSQKEKKSTLKNVIFDSLSLDQNSNWTITGAVMFHNTNVSITNCSFSNNQSEDALNIISSNFDLKNIQIMNTFSDGFDADFSTGTINQCVFSNTGNDGVDISGSNVIIENCEIFNILDKAISSGERSKLKVENCNISSSNIALAAKDESIITVNSVNIKNTGVCYAIFQKKSEFNPAKISVLSSTELNYKQLYLLDFNSSLDYKDELFIGSKHINVDSLYLPFKKRK